MSDPGMLGDSGFEKRLRDNVQRLEESIDSQGELVEEKIGRVDDAVKHLKELVEQDRRALRDATVEKNSETATHFASINEFNHRMEKVVNEQASKELVAGIENAVAAKFEAQTATVRALEGTLGARLTALESRNTQVRGKEEGIKLSATTLYAALGATVLLITIIVFVSKFIPAR